MKEETLKQAIELNGQRDKHQSLIERIEHFENSIPEADIDDPWDDIDVILSSPDDSITLEGISNQLKADILALVKKYHRDQVDNTNIKIQEL